MIIDTHAHLDDKQFNNDLNEVLKNAKTNGVHGILIPGANIEDLPRARDIAYQNRDVYFAAGVHPYHHNQYNESILKKFLSDKKCIAVGECGLDYYRLSGTQEDKESEKIAQKEVFSSQIKLAKSVKKPLIIHIRDSSVDSKSLLLENQAGDVGGVIHCYNADDNLLNLIEDGFYFGIGGVLTFKNAKKLLAILPKIPLDKIVVETDAPYLAPHPNRGKRNEPSYTKFVVDKIAEILQKDIKYIEELTTCNAKKLFKEFAK